MKILNQLTCRGAGAFAAGAALLLNLSLAQAVPFNSNVIITGSNTFDDFNSYNGSGGFSMVSSGVTSNSSYDLSSVVSGAGNPLAGALTDTGDGFGFSGTANVSYDDFVIGFDAAINVINNTSITQEVVFRLSFSNTVNADDPADYDTSGITDAYAHSNLFLFDGIDDIFFSDLMSDTVNGDANGGINVTPESYGATLTESGDLLFTYFVNPADSLDLLLRWELDGGDFEGGQAYANTQAFLSVERVVPIPGALWLMLSGMLVLLQRAVRR